MSTILVALASSAQSSSVARYILASGQKVHALVRDPSARVPLDLAEKGATLFPYDYNNPDLSVLKKALQGTTGIFLNTYIEPSNPSAQLTQVQTILQTAATLPNPPKAVVLSTAFFTGKHEEWSNEDPNYILSRYYAAKVCLENEILSYDFLTRWTILRPAWLMYNYMPPYHNYHFPELPSQRELVCAYKPGTRIPHFSPDDLGAIAAAALTAAEDDERFARKIFELGYENLTIEEAARILSKVVGTEIGVKYRSEAEVKEAEKIVPTQIFHIWSRDHDLTIDPTPLQGLGVKLTTLEEYFEKNKEVMRQSLGLEG